MTFNGVPERFPKFKVGAVPSRGTIRLVERLARGSFHNFKD